MNETRFNRDLPRLWSSIRRVDADRRLPDLLRMQGLRPCDPAKGRGLLRVLLLWRHAVSTDTGDAKTGRRQRMLLRRIGAVSRRPLASGSPGRLPLKARPRREEACGCAAPAAALLYRDRRRTAPMEAGIFAGWRRSPPRRARPLTRRRPVPGGRRLNNQQIAKDVADIKATHHHRPERGFRLRLV